VSTKHEPKKDADNDDDNPSNSHYDGDDYFGQAASAADKRAVAALVKRYYTAAAAGDGAAACSLVYAIVAEAVPEEFNSSALRGKTCAVVATKLFKQRHQQLATDLAKLQVTGVRVKGRRGWVLLSFGEMFERRMLVHREGGAWKIETLLNVGVP
jgi:hypothetical protein